MKTAKKLSGLSVATAAAALFMSGCGTMGTEAASSDAMASKVHCGGINSCKGQTACGTANNACKGQNSCKGQGWLPMSQDECDAKGGKVTG
jgi:hypothetical protein